MASTTSQAARAGSVGAEADAPRSVSPAEAAWLAAVPCALVVLAAILLLAPPLGDLALQPNAMRFLPQLTVMPEPTEQARFLIALLGPLLLCASILLLTRRPVRVGAGAQLVARAAQPLLLAFLAFAVVTQHAVAYPLDGARRVFFTVPTLVVAVAFAAGLAALLARQPAVERVRAAVRETPRRRLAALIVAALFTALWLLTAFNTEGSVGKTISAVRDNIPLWLDESFAVMNGMYPLVSFHSQYGQLAPYAAAGAMTVFGASYTVYATAMISATLAAMLGIYATFRRIVSSSLVALALFMPFLATSFFKEHGTLENRYGPSNLFSLFPIRYAGPFVLAWLLARHLDGARPHDRRVLFLVAGLVLLNNAEFGLPAFAATLAALVWTAGRPTLRSLARLSGDAAIGAVAALACVALLTLVVAGSLPDLGLLSEFPSIYGGAGFGLLPMATVGFHLAIYVTFAAALVLATVRALGGERDRLMTGMLCWMGVFGLGAGAYFAGRSHPEVLIDVFSPWAIAVALLLVVAVRDILRRPLPRRPTAAELAVMASFGLIVCSLAQTPTPWSQASRIADTTATPKFRLLAAERWIDERTSPGERIAIVGPLGHRIAHNIGVRDVFPYAHLASIPALEQWDTIVRVLREEDVEKVYFTTQATIERLYDFLVAAGYAGYEQNDEADLIEMRPAGVSGG